MLLDELLDPVNPVSIVYLKVIVRLFLDRLRDHCFFEVIISESPAIRWRHKRDTIHKRGDLTNIGPFTMLKILGSRHKLDSGKKDLSNKGQIRQIADEQDGAL